MEKFVVKFKFISPVHFGDLEQLPNNFSNTDYVVQNDTIFSALMIEAINLYGEEKVKHIYDIFLNDCKISSMMPYINDTYYLPKPLLEDKREIQDDLKTLKIIKNLRFLPASKVNEYTKILNGQGLLNDFVIYKSELEKLGKYSIIDKVNISRDNQDNSPWSLGIFTFSKNCGTYIVVTAENSTNEVIDLLKNLQYSGIGGRRSSGYGHFEIEIINLSQTDNIDLKTLNTMLDKKSDRFMTLSICLPNKPDEENLKDAYYYVVRRSGFITSTNFSDEFIKKDDTYAFMVGSTFTKLFDGQIRDVSNNAGTHKVYKHLIPLFVGVENE